MRFQFTPIVKNILIINVLMFLASNVLDQTAFNELMIGYYPENEKFAFWQPLTSMFMHADLRHIFFNMFGLVMFGPRLENNWGSQKFLFFYIFTGLGAFLTHFLVVYIQLTVLESGLSMEDLQLIATDGMTVFYTPDVVFSDPDVNKYNNLLHSGVLGASGAVYGVLMAYGLRYPNDTVMLLFPPIPMKVKYLVLALGIFTLLSGLGNASDGIAHFAHLGGMIFAYFLLKYWQKKRDQQNMYYH